MKHTHDCQEAFEKTKREQREYDLAWPNHCRECSGVGFIVDSFDPSPSGVSLSSGSMTSIETCTECLDEGKCPRCGSQFQKVDEEEFDFSNPCPVCKFDTAHPVGRPEIAECFCYLSE